MSLQADLCFQHGAQRLEVALDVAAGETLAIVGPNGAGKSTFLQAIAGLLPQAKGKIACMNQSWLDSEQGIHCPPDQRGCSLMFQDLRLFPHLSLLGNLEFPLRAQGVDRNTATQKAHAWLERMQLASRANAHPAQLSGGEQQRAALARALIAEPKALLLDEPLAAIDVSRRIELRRLLVDCLAEFNGPCILVSHDAVDALSLAERVAVLENGRLVQLDQVAKICAQPGSEYVADFIGLNLLHGHADSGKIQLESGAAMVVADEISGPVSAVVHPRAIALFPEKPSGSPRNVWQAEVRSIESFADRLRVRLGGACPLVAEITPSAWQELELQAGSKVWLSLKATEISVFAR